MTSLPLPFPAPLRDPVYAGNKRAAVHRWVRWIAGFSAEFAGGAIDQYVRDGASRAEALVLDPFAGVGTTLIEAQRRGIRSVGFEINPFAALVARAKLEAALVSPAALSSEVERYAESLGKLEAELNAERPVPCPRRAPPPGFHTRVPFYSPAVERKVLHSLDYVDGIGDTAIGDLFRLAFASTMVTYSNYTFEPSLGTRLGAGKPSIPDADVSDSIAARLREMVEDVAGYAQELRQLPEVPRSDARSESFFEGAPDLADASVDLVVTSPPYLNNYHYVRNTRPHLYWLGFIATPREQVRFEIESFGKFWQTVRDGPEVDLAFDLPALACRIGELRDVNPAKKVYGGAGWANYAATYYNDSHRLLAQLARLLRPRRGTAIIVVGNNVLQGLEFKVDEHLVSIGNSLGLQGRTAIVRKTRVGSSIMGTGARQKVARPIELYEAAVTLWRG